MQSSKTSKIIARLSAPAQSDSMVAAHLQMRNRRPARCVDMHHNLRTNTPDLSGCLPACFRRENGFSRLGQIGWLCAKFSPRQIPRISIIVLRRVLPIFMHALGAGGSAPQFNGYCIYRQRSLLLIFWPGIDLYECCLG